MTDAWMPGAERVSAADDGGCLKGGAPRAVWLVLHADPMTVSARAAAEHLVEVGRPAHLVWNPLSGDVVQLIPVVRAGRALGWDDGPNWGPRSAGPGWGQGRGPGWPGWGAGYGWAKAPERTPRSGTERQGRAGYGGWDQQDDWMLGDEWGQGPGREAEPDRPFDTTWTHGADWTPGAGWTHGRDRRQMAAGAAPFPGEPIAPIARDGLAGVNTEGRACVQIAVIGHAWAPFTNGPLVRAREIASWLDSWHVARRWPAGRPPPFPGSVRPAHQHRRNWARGGHFGSCQVPGHSGAGPGAIDIEQLTGPLGCQPGPNAARGPGNPARISAMTWQPRLTPARSAVP